MNEIVINLHIHTRYSDGHCNHAEICNAAIDCGLDAIITTDHNVLVQGINRYHEQKGKKVLLLTGEEVHDQGRESQKNHLLVLGAGTEVATYAENTQELINYVKSSGGLSFIAHPIDPALPLFNETDISWVDWSVTGYDGIELWNGLSELKTVIGNRFDAIKYGFFPRLLAHNPLPEILKIWDDLLNKGNKIVAIGGSDSHGIPMTMGPFKRTIFPYHYHFSSINTHLLIPHELTGNSEMDSKSIYTALKKGNAFIGYDLPQDTRGFSFMANSHNSTTLMGDEVRLSNEPVSLEITLPKKGEINLLRDGEIIKTESTSKMLYHTSDPGVYRVEVYRKYLFKRRGWIFSNPIYVCKE